jgi:phosphate transport system substrate-binding protein
MEDLAKAYEKKSGVKIVLQGGGATKGIRQVSGRTADLGGSCRHTLEDPERLSPVPDERRVQLDPVAWDALAVMVHKSNPVNNVSLDQIRKIYTGKITNWKELGGNDAPIEVYVRNGKISGVGRTLRELVFYDYDQEFRAPHLKVEKSTGPLEKAIAGDAVNGIGISGISSARKRNVKLLKLEGKEPSYQHIKSGDYLLYRPLYLVTNLYNLDKPEIKQFADFVHSDEGREVIRKAGSVPYEDAIALWIKYLASVRKAQENGLRQSARG